MNRIVSYIGDIATRCAYLRESAGNYEPQEIHPFVVIAREYDESGKCTRTWFLGMGQANDGQNSFGNNAPRHKIVDPHIEAGVESKPADPMYNRGGDLQALLHKLKQNEIKNILAVRQTETFCGTYHGALQRAADSEAELKTADENVRNLAQRNANLATELQQAQADLEALRTEKSLTQRVRAWFPKRD